MQLYLFISLFSSVENSRANIDSINTLHEHTIFRNADRLLLYASFPTGASTIFKFWILEIMFTTWVSLQDWRTSPFLWNVVSPCFRDFGSFYTLWNQVTISTSPRTRSCSSFEVQDCWRDNLKGKHNRPLWVAVQGPWTARPLYIHSLGPFSDLEEGLCSP
jgi:hypothetical protein